MNGKGMGAQVERMVKIGHPKRYFRFISGLYQKKANPRKATADNKRPFNPSLVLLGGPLNTYIMATMLI